MAQLELQNAGKDFPRHGHAVANLSLSIRNGEYVALVGPSGSGKTTALRLVSGLTQPTEGKILIDGVDCTRHPPHARKIGMVFQNYALYPHLTVHKNLAFGPRLRKNNPTEIERRVQAISRRLGIENLSGRLPHELSGGQQQRVALGRAIIGRPAVCLLDEPLSNLDSNLRVEMRRELKRLHRDENMTTLHVTHDEEEAMILGQRVAVIRDGRLQQFDTPENIYRFPQNRFVARFFGNPRMNFVAGSLIACDEQICFQSNRLTVRLSPEQSNRVSRFLRKSVWLGIRPEDIVLVQPTARHQANIAHGTIQSVDCLGATNHIYVAHEDGTELAVSSRQLDGFSEGSTLGLRVDSSAVHLFPRKTDERDVEEPWDEPNLLLTSR